MIIRSPRAPRVTLKDSIAAVGKLFKEATRAEVTRDVAAQQMGYSGKSGPSLTLLASLIEYGLLEKRGANVKVSSTAVQILHPTGETQKLEAIQRAASHPGLFAELLKTHADCGLGVLAAGLVQRGFTPQSAKKTASVFRENLEFAKLKTGVYSPADPNIGDEDEEEEEIQDDPPPPPDPNAGGKGGQVGSGKPKQDPPPAPPKFQPMNAEAMLPIPLEIGDAFIPRGMSDDDFQLLLDSLNLWKRRIVRSDWPKSAIWRNADHDQPVTITGPMGEKDGVKYYRASTGTGIPESELEF